MNFLFSKQLQNYNAILQQLSGNDRAANAGYFICAEPCENSSTHNNSFTNISHYVFGIFFPNTQSLFIANPVGHTDHKGFYDSLSKLVTLGIVKEIFISNTVIQDIAHEKSVSTCGPICVELMNHLADMPSEDIYDILKQQPSTQVKKNELDYYSVDISGILPVNLKKLQTNKQQQQQLLKKQLRTKHLNQLKTDIAKNIVAPKVEQKEEYWAEYCENHPIQQLITRLNHEGRDFNLLDLINSMQIKQLKEQFIKNTMKKVSNKKLTIKSMIDITEEYSTYDATKKLYYKKSLKKLDLTKLPHGCRLYKKIRITRSGTCKYYIVDKHTNIKEVGCVPYNTYKRLSDAPIKKRKRQESCCKTYNVKPNEFEPARKIPKINNYNTFFQPSSKLDGSSVINGCLWRNLI